MYFFKCIFPKCIFPKCIFSKVYFSKKMYFCKKKYPPCVFSKLGEFYSYPIGACTMTHWQRQRRQKKFAYYLNKRAISEKIGERLEKYAWWHTEILTFFWFNCNTHHAPLSIYLHIWIYLHFRKMKVSQAKYPCQTPCSLELATLALAWVPPSMHQTFELQAL